MISGNKHVWVFMRALAYLLLAFLSNVSMSLPSEKPQFSEKELLPYFFFYFFLMCISFYLLCGSMPTAHGGQRVIDLL